MALPDNFEELVAIGAERFPEYGRLLAEADERLRIAILTGDIDGGAAALADWIDARSLLAAYATLGDRVVPDGPPKES